MRGAMLGRMSRRGCACFPHGFFLLLGVEEHTSLMLGFFLAQVEDEGVTKIG